MKREVLRVEPLSTWLEALKAPASAVSRSGNMVFVSGLPPFDPQTGKVLAGAPIEQQAERAMQQMKLCLEAAGATFDNVMKCNVYCTQPKYFPAINAVYARYFPDQPPARIFICVPEWLGPFDIEIDCIAML